MSGYTPFKMKGPSLYRSPTKQQDAAEKKMESQLFDGDKDENKLDGDKTSTQNKHTSTPSESKDKTRVDKPSVKKDFSDESKYKTVRKGRTGGIAQDIETGKYYNTGFGHEMVSDTITDDFGGQEVKWYKKGDDE